MEPRQFDDISRALASGSSRRSVLRGMLGGLIAGVLGRSQALAQDDCPGRKVTICHRTKSKKNPFNVIEICSDSLPDHEAHGDLVSCPGAGSVDFETCACICPLTDEECPNLEVVDEEACACFCPVDEIVCGDGQTLNLETCACEKGPDPECAGAVCNSFEECDSTNPDCICTTLFHGGGFCVPGSTSCGSLAACGADGSCAEGSLCAVNTCCGTPVCIPVDLECSGGGASFGAFSDGGPTIGGQ